MKMRSVGKKGDKIELQMTPMIDIVFQLLIFFIMTFKIVIPEGDFNIKMPLAAPAQGPPDESLALQVKIKLTANAEGQLVRVRMNDNSWPVTNTDDEANVFNTLHLKVMDLVGTDSGPDSLAAGTEVEFDVDFNLRYQYVIRAITAVSGYVNAEKKTIVKLIEKIKFTPPKDAA